MTEYLIQTEDHLFYPAKPDDLRRAHPNTSFPADLDLADYVDWGVHVVHPSPPDSIPGMAARPTTPVNIGGEWYQAWEMLEAGPPSVPSVVSMRQARLAMLNAAILGDVEEAISLMEEPQRSAVRIEWEYATEVKRNSPTMMMLANALSLEEEQIDELFIEAARL